ncbi:hypothetical protein KH5_04310 [Urechidicola sp. KH5]
MLMGLVVLFSSFSYTVNTHYCGDTIVDTAIFAKAKSCCGMDMNHESKSEENSSSTHCDDNEAMRCKDTKQIIDGNDIEQQAAQSEQLPDVYFSLALAYVYTAFDVQKTEASKEITFYKPPLQQENITVLFENFRI